MKIASGKIAGSLGILGGSCLMLIGCSGTEEADDPPVLCASVGYVTLAVPLSSPLGPGTYSLTVEADGSEGTCEGSQSTDLTWSHGCSGELLLDFSAEGFNLWNVAPPTINLRLEHLESGAVMQRELLPEYEPLNEEHFDECPSLHAEMTLELEGMPTGQAP